MSEDKINLEVVQKLTQNLLNENQYYTLAEFFKIFGDATRIRILHLLSIQELCVGDIAATLNLTQSATSHQLKILKQYRVAKYRREGKMTYYSICDEHIKSIFTSGLEHIQEEQ